MKMLILGHARHGKDTFAGRKNNMSTAPDHFFLTHLTQFYKRKKKKKTHLPTNIIIIIITTATIIITSNTADVLIVGEVGLDCGFIVSDVVVLPSYAEDIAGSVFVEEPRSLIQREREKERERERERGRHR